jgi:hypothetical protein
MSGLICVANVLNEMLGIHLCLGRAGTGKDHGDEL